MPTNELHSRTLSVQNLRTEYLENPLGIDERRPRLSWQVASCCPGSTSEGRGVMQLAYQVQVARDAAALARGDLLWDSGEVASDAISTRLAGPRPVSRERFYWRVRVWDQDRCVSEWSEPAWWEMGLLEEREWTADWIEVGWDEDPKAYKPCPYFRRAFTVDGPVVSARLYITSHGLYEAWINDERVGDQLFTPGYTTYDKRLQYQVYDVTGMIHPGGNALGAILGDGWYRGKVYAPNARNVYGDRLGLLALLILQMGDGRLVRIGTGEGWKCVTGPLLKADMKDGEVYDARLEMPGWSTAAYEDSGWKPVRVAQHPKNHLVASMGVPVRRKETFRPKAIIATPKGETVIDFGQNLAGVVRMSVLGPAGTTVHLTHGETLDKDGNFTQDHLFIPPARSGKEPFQEDFYTLKGGTVEVYEPRFTVHGFRYVKLEGYPGQPLPDAFISTAIYSDMPASGAFTCSDPLLNQLHHNVEWSMKSNFLDLPTDCPQRERAGWTGDAQIFAPTASFLMDTRAFFRKWLADLALEQRADGAVGSFIPNPIRLAKGFNATWFNVLDGSAGWGDCSVILPWELYNAYGDVEVLERQYDSMKRWIDFVHKRAEHTNLVTKLAPRYWRDAAYRTRQRLVVDAGYQWGEWLEPGEGGTLAMGLGMLRRLLFGEPVVATAYFAYSARLLGQIANLLDKKDDAAHYRHLADQVKAIYAAEFIGPDGRIEPDRQASYVRVLALDLAPEPLKPAIVGNLVRLVRASGNHIGTGFLSTVFLCDVLAENGHLDVAYDVLMQKTIPSWLYPVTKGATTIWETWEGIREDGTPQLSLNHYSPGAVANFLHGTVAGIRAAEPGYRCIDLRPQPGGGLTSAAASYDSAYGLIASAWSIDEDVMRVAITIPANTRATVTLPRANRAEVMEGRRPLSEAPGVPRPIQSGVNTVLGLGSGAYTFEYPLRQELQG